MLKGEQANALGVRAPVAATPALVNSDAVSRTMARPGIPVPRGACDCHVHVFDPARFPYAPDRTYTPGAATVEELDRSRQSLGL